MEKLAPEVPSDDSQTQFACDNNSSNFNSRFLSVGYHLHKRQTDIKELKQLICRDLNRDSIEIQSYEGQVNSNLSLCALYHADFQTFAIPQALCSASSEEFAHSLNDKSCFETNMEECPILPPHVNHDV